MPAVDLLLREKKINFSEPPSFWMFLLYLAKLNPHRHSAARHTLTGSLDEGSSPKECWAVTGHFTWVRPVFFSSTHIFYVQDGGRSLCCRAVCYRPWIRWFGSEKMFGIETATWLPQQKPPGCWENEISPLRPFKMIELPGVSAKWANQRCKG